MSTNTGFNLEDYADSPYARELHKGFPGLQFSAPLEAEYRQFYLADRRPHTRYYQPFVAALAVAMQMRCMLDGAGLDFGPRSIFAAVAVVCCLVLSWAAYSDRYQKIFVPVGGAMTLLFATCLAVEISYRIVAGHSDEFAFLTIYSLALYFLGGILYMQAVRANIALVTALGVTLLVLHQPVLTVLHFVAILASTAFVGGASFNALGRKFRASFLIRGVLHEIGTHDGLTGLNNRRAFNNYLPRIWQQALSDRRQFAVLLIDVDHFKLYNDRYGHQAGDQTLRRVAEVVQRFALRPLDMAARYGGEEIALVLYDMKQSVVEAITTQLINGVQGLGIEHRESRVSAYVTVSVGVAIIRPSLEHSPDGAVQLADEALYAAKSTGRNRSVTLDSEIEHVSTGIFRNFEIGSPG